MKFVYILVLCGQVILSPALGTPLINEDELQTVIKEETKPSYEVTENVIDVPDTRPKLPIIANFGVHTPLNLAKPETTDNEKSHKLSLLEIHSVTDDKIDFSTEFDQKDTNVFNGIKTYFKGLKKNILNGIHSWLSKKIDQDFA